MSTPKKILIGVTVLLVGIVGFALTPTGESLWRREAIELLTPTYAAPVDAGDKTPIFDGLDATRPAIRIGLRPIAQDFDRPVALVPVPGKSTLMVVAEKGGKAWWFDRAKPTSRGVLVDLDVVTASEQGLLGIVFHPRFADTGRFFVNATQSVDGRDVTRVLRYAVSPGADLRSAKAKMEAVVIEVEQPYQNHNAGDLAFGPDGMLYVGLGDGGFRDDPHNHGQDRSTLLGAMLRLDVDGATDGRGYAIPADNPFVGTEGVRPEIWAYGLRNPWRYSFAPDGRMVIADVGQDKWEEITVLGRGENAGWKIREADHCFPPSVDKCATEGMVDPVFTYGRQDGASVTGGYVYAGSAIPALAGHYVFGDFLSGRFWALELPAPGGQGKVRSLGRWGVLVSSFGLDQAGELYALDFQTGIVYQFVAAP